MKDSKEKAKKKRERKQITKRLELERVMETIEIIDEMLLKGVALDDIKREIGVRIYSSMGYIEMSFKKHVGCTVSQYIRAHKYVALYQEWKKMRPPLAQKEKYKGCDNFKQNFKRDFGVDLELASEKDILHDIQFGRKTLEFINSNVITREWVESYEFVNGTLEMENDIGKMFKHLMTCKTYFLHRKYAERVKWNELEKDLQKATLIGLSYSQDKNISNEDGVISYEEFYTEMKDLDLLYDISNPLELGDWLIFPSTLWEPMKYKIPELMVSCNEERFYITYPEEILIPKKWVSFRRAFDDNNDVFRSLVTVMIEHKLEIKQIADLNWELLVKGFVRMKKE